MDSNEIMGLVSSVEMTFARYNMRPSVTLDVGTPSTRASIPSARAIAFGGISSNVTPSCIL